MDMIAFESFLADPYIWIIAATNNYGQEYYEYVLLYVDKFLVILNKPEAILRKEIGRHFKLKEESIGAPSQYLGGNMRQAKMENGQECWAFGSTQYVRAEVENVEEYLGNRREKLAAKALTPLSIKYCPEVDINEELADEEASYYQFLIGVLMWIVELGRYESCVEVSMMSSQLALPQRDHLDEVLHIF